MLKVILKVFLGLVGLAVFYLAASLGVIDVPWLSDSPDDVVVAEPEPRTRVSSSGNDRPIESARQGSEPEFSLPPVRDARAIEKLIDLDLSDDDHFEIVLSESEIDDLLLAELSRDGRIRTVDVDVTPDVIEFNGELKGRIPVPFHGSLKFMLEAGKAIVDL